MRKKAEQYESCMIRLNFDKNNEKDMAVYRNFCALGRYRGVIAKRLIEQMILAYPNELAVEDPVFFQSLVLKDTKKSCYTSDVQSQFLKQLLKEQETGTSVMSSEPIISSIGNPEQVGTTAASLPLQEQPPAAHDSPGEAKEAPIRDRHGPIFLSYTEEVPDEEDEEEYDMWNSSSSGSFKYDGSVDLDDD